MIGQKDHLSVMSNPSAESRESNIPDHAMLVHAARSRIARIRAPFVVQPRGGPGRAPVTSCLPSRIVCKSVYFPRRSWSCAVKAHTVDTPMDDMHVYGECEIR